MTKNCTDGTLFMEDGYIRFVIKYNPDMKLIFKCEDSETFNYIKSLKSFLREQKHYEELSHAKMETDKFKYLFQQKCKR